MAQFQQSVAHRPGKLQPFLNRMAEDIRRRRSRSRGDRKRNTSPSLECNIYAAESYEEGFKAGFRRGSFTDGAEQGFKQGYNARRMMSAQSDHNDFDDGDDSDGSDNDGDDWKRTFAMNNIDDIMDAIEEIETPDRYLEEIVREYRHHTNTTDEDATDSETDDETEYYYSDDDNDDDDKDDKDTDTDQGNKSNDEK